MVLLTLTMILSSGCSTESIYIKSAEKYGYFNYYNVSYGMPYEECKAALDKNKVEFVERNNDEGFTTLSFDNNFNDIPCEVHLFIMTGADYPVDVGLYRIAIQFNDYVDFNESLMTVYDQIDSKKIPYKGSGSGESDGGMTHSSFDSISSIQTIQDSNIADKAMSIAESAYGSNYDGIGFVKMESLPLETITLSSAEDGKRLSTVTFKGNFAGVVALAEKECS